jgi:hypothetical protein
MRRTKNPTEGVAMKSSNLFSPKCAPALILILLLIQSNALAGPPLLCFPFEIGSAKSLPWQGRSWESIRPDYDISRLVDDTFALLSTDAPVIVRMETLRRATIYARKDRKVADALLARMKKRAAEAERDPLALFDAGYLIESYRQAYWISTHSGETYWKFSQADPGKDVEGYALVLKAIQSRGGDPDMEFAAALITTDPERRSQHDEHLRRAIAGAKDGSLLARNLESHFKQQGKSIV